ncbi:MAG: hypothetical protein EA351_04255 [Gemmatimonadales bacterium]|nr:MAG: hypothetical protein EA351_04255 [Gemmatimonadales bacterium]
MSEDTLPTLPRRVVMVVTAPVTLFERLKERPVSLGAMILGALLVGAAAAMIPVELMQETIREQMIAAGQDPGEAVGTAGRVAWVFGIFGPLVFWPLLAVITAGLYSVIFLFAFGYEGSFRKLLSITAHALLVAALGTLLLAPLRMITADPQLTLSVGSFFFFLEDGILLRFLELLDLFNLWTYVLIGIGAAVIDGSRSRTEGAMVALGAAVLFSFVLAALTG